MPSPRPRLTRRRVLVAAGAAALALGVAAAVVILHSPGNVSHPKLSFTAPKPPPPAPPRPRVSAPPFLWADYGYDAARTRYIDPPGAVTPPFRVGWHFLDRALLEFPPVIDGDSLYILDDDGMARAIDAGTGHVRWHVKLGTLAAASPAIDVRAGLVVFVLLSRTGTSPGNGRVAALSERTGKVLWSRPIPAGSESSPLVWGGSVYFGDQSGAVYSLGATSGRVRWIYHARGSVKGGLAESGGILYFGDYAGRVYALHARSGHVLWDVGTSGSAFGFGSGNFYSTPAVAFGRVYLGNTDGFVYSFAARTGQLAWSRDTGAYVYASPAVADLPGIGPTVYMGSYNNRFYAFNAASGAIRWSHPSGGRISGAATIVGHVVYYSDLGTRSTTGLDARSGRVLFRFHDGAFNPVIADDRALYLDGYITLYELLPRGSAATQRSSRSHRPAARRRSASRTRGGRRRGVRRRRSRR
jgi:outer membrane protein assembly factor BamB